MGLGSQLLDFQVKLFLREGRRSWDNPATFLALSQNSSFPLLKYWQEAAVCVIELSLRVFCVLRLG